MREKKIEKIVCIIDWLSRSVDKIVNKLMGFLGLSALLILCPLICAFFAHKSSLTQIYGIDLAFLYQVSLGLQVLICLVVTVFSFYIRNKRWGKELTTGNAGTLSAEEKDVMIRCGYKSDEVGWLYAKEIANDALSQFKRFWFWIWLSWVFLYMTYFIRHCLGNKIKFIDSILNPLSNVNTLMILICYLILFEITVPDKRARVSKRINWLPWVALLLILTYVEIMIRSLDILDAKKQSCVEIFDWINGITSGAVMALFVGAFDNEFIKPKFTHIAPLYLYMAIQAIFPTYLNYGERLEINVLISITTLVCKIILFLFVFEQIKSGRLLFYFIRIRKLHYDFDEKWDEFLKSPEIAFNKRASNDAKEEIELKRANVRLQ